MGVIVTGWTVGVNCFAFALSKRGGAMDMNAMSVASESLSYLPIWIFHAIYLNGGGPLFVLVSFLLYYFHHIGAI